MTTIYVLQQIMVVEYYLKKKFKKNRSKRKFNPIYSNFNMFQFRCWRVDLPFRYLLYMEQVIPLPFVCQSLSLLSLF